MGKRFDAMSDSHKQLIAEQKLFFVATAPDEGRINLSPKGMDSFRVIDNNTVAWLNVTGSGNETAAHVAENGRMTVMFCAFAGKPVILRLYGHAQVIHQRDSEWKHLFALFEPLAGARQIFVLNVELVQSSCGMAVPYFDYAGERELLKDWATKKGESGIQDYWRDRNQHSLDGRETGILVPVK
ncbi:MAG: pyridoxamine 5'-phosphate oxidase family protein [Rhodanobacteraceae bacterium]|nr:pyridoxamine 5'-phosphate oxidase family protein [Rhodanobacteraceae bacterium]